MTEETLITIGTYFLYVFGVIMYLGMGSILNLAYLNFFNLDLYDVGAKVLFCLSVLLWPITMVIVFICNIFEGIFLAMKAIFTGDF